MIAAHLLAQDAGGEMLAELAGLSERDSPWLIDQILLGALGEAGVPSLTDEEAGEFIGRVIGQLADAVPGADEYAVVRALARLAPDLDYPAGVIAEANEAAEWLDCECHIGSAERAEAAALEHRLRSQTALDIDSALLTVLADSCF